MGRSSAVALDRTAQATSSPRRASARVIAAARSSGTAVASMLRRISALSVRIASRSSGSRRDSRSSRSSIDGAPATIRAKASVVTQKPGGTLTPSIRTSSARYAPLPPTRAACAASISWKPSTWLPGWAVCRIGSQVPVSLALMACSVRRERAIMEGTRGLETSPPAGDTLEVAGGVRWLDAPV